MDNKRALVTGATGFIGNRLVLELRSRGWDVVALVRRSVVCTDPGISVLAGDLGWPETMNLDPSRTGRIDVLFHLAAWLPTHLIPADAATYLTANAVATTRLLQTAITRQIPTIIYLSSVAVIGKPERLPVDEDHPTHPLHPYVLSKLCGELACELFRQTEARRITSLRITSCYGPGMPTTTVLPRFVRRALDSEDLLWFGTGQRTQNFVHVRDAVRSLVLAAETSKPGVYNVAGSSSISMRELAKLIVRLAEGSRSRVLPAGSPDPQDDFRWEIDLRRAESGLGYRPEIPLKQGISELIEFTRTGVATPRWWSEP